MPTFMSQQIIVYSPTDDAIHDHNAGKCIVDMSSGKSVFTFVNFRKFILLLIVTTHRKDSYNECSTGAFLSLLSLHTAGVINV